MKSARKKKKIIIIVKHILKKALGIIVIIIQHSGLGSLSYQLVNEKPQDRHRDRDVYL